MAYDITKLNAFAAANKKLLISNVVTGFQSYNIMTPQTGIKKSEKILDITKGTLVLRGGDNTGMNRFDGGVAMLEKTMEVIPLGTSQKYSNFELDGTIAQMGLKAGKNSDDIPNVDVILSLVKDALGDLVDAMVWRGVKGTNSFDGIETKLLASTTAKKTGAAATEITEANAIAKISAFIKSFKKQVPKQNGIMKNIYMSEVAFSNWYRATYGLNGKIDANTINALEPVTQARVPGENFQCIATIGMNGSNNLIAGRVENFRFGTDLLSDTDKVNWRFESLINQFVLDIDFKAGSELAREEECLITKA